MHTTVVAGKRRAPESTRHRLIFFAAVATLAIASWHLGAHHQYFVSVVRTLVKLEYAILLHVLSMTLVALIGFLISLALWVHPHRRRASAITGGLFLLSALSFLYEAVNAGSYALAAHDLYRIELALDAGDNAQITALGDGRIRIVGSIGRNLLRDLRALEEGAHGPLFVLEIDSPGGLVDRALELARIVERRQLTVIVRGQCLSACVLVAVASPRSYADENAIFGFHRSSPVATVTSEIAVYGAQQLEEESREFLSAHGVPSTVLQEASRHGPESLYFVSASEMVELGAIHGTLSKDRIVKQGRKQ